MVYPANCHPSGCWFTSKNAVVDVGLNEEIIDSHYKIFNYVIEEKPGYQKIASGMIMKMLGCMISIDKQKDFSGKRVEKIIQNACSSIMINHSCKKVQILS